MGPIGPKHQHDLQNEEHKLKGDTTTYLKVNQRDKWETVLRRGHSQA